MLTKSSRTLRFDRQSDSWFAGLPVGNGRAGAMVTGGVPVQTLHLNDETFWSPGPSERDFSGARSVMARVRSLLASDDVLGAQAAARPLLGTPALGAALQPVGDVTFFTDIDVAGAHFSRSLDLATGIASFEWVWDDGTSLTRQIVALRSPSVFVVRQTTTAAVGETRVEFRSAYGADIELIDGGTLVAQGRWHEVAANRQLAADSYRLRDYTGRPPLRFVTGISLLDGEQESAETALILSSPEWAVAVTVGTDLTADDPLRWVVETLARAQQPTELLMSAAIAEHADVFTRATISLDSPAPISALPTDSRVHAVRAGGIDDDLVLLLSDYGRYLQIASTLGGTLPPTLQGVWNADTEPAWSSNYTLNINLQMNLWSADAFQFREAGKVLHDFVTGLAAAGQRTASELYGAKGWVVHHNSDVWLNTAPTTLVEVGLFAGAGLWLVQQLRRHDESYPEDADTESLFALMSGLGDFLETWLVADRDGFLVPSPSSSPEDGYLLGDTPRPRSRADDPEFWRHGWIGTGSTIEISLIRDTLESLVSLGHRVGAPAHRVASWSSMLELLRPIVFRDGEIPEWTWPSRPLELGHRHLSPLYGLYPGAEDIDASPAFQDAARTTLENHLANVTSSSNGWGGWSKVWAAACWARLGDGDRALASVSSLLSTGIAPDSLLHAFPDFDGEPGLDAVHQSDANLGLAAAVSELVLRSTPGRIRLLPALPSRWNEGTARNLRAAGGVDVTFRWSGRRVSNVVLLASRNQSIELLTPGSPAGSWTSQAVTLIAGRPETIALHDIESKTQEEDPE